MDQIAELQFGLSEGVTCVFGDEQAGDAQDIASDGLGDVCSQFLGLGLLFGGQCLGVLHGCSFREYRGALWSETGFYL